MAILQTELTSLFRSLKIQRRVVFALLMREIMTRYGRHNIGFLWLFVEPMLFTTGVTVLWTATKSLHGSSLPIEAFALTGYSTVLLWRNMPSRCVGAITPNLSLMYHRQVKVIDIFLARVILEGMGASISFVVLTLTFMAAGIMKAPEDVQQVFLGWMLIAWFGSALGILAGALAEVSEFVEKLWHPLTYLLFPLSGAAFSVDSMPKVAQDLLMWVPMVSGVEMVREGFFGSVYKAHYDVEYLTLFCVALTLLALAQVRIVARQVVPE